MAASSRCSASLRSEPSLPSSRSSSPSEITPRAFWRRKPSALLYLVQPPLKRRPLLVGIAARPLPERRDLLVQQNPEHAGGGGEVDRELPRHPLRLLGADVTAVLARPESRTHARGAIAPAEAVIQVWLPLATPGGRGLHFGPAFLTPGDAAGERPQPPAVVRGPPVLPYGVPGRLHEVPGSLLSVTGMAMGSGTKNGVPRFSPNHSRSYLASLSSPAATSGATRPATFSVRGT